MRATQPWIWGAALGSLLLGWSLLAILTPEIASLLAVFGSPVVAFLIIVGMLSSRPALRSGKLGSTPTDGGQDVALQNRIVAAQRGACADCGSRGRLSLQQVLPVGRYSRDLERRFVALCDGCKAART